MNLIGAELRNQRESKDWSQDDLARRCQLMGWDISRETVTRIETRQRLVSDYEVCLLAVALGIDAHKLIPSSPDLSGYLRAKPLDSGKG
ncbi:MAG: helix-turn-helix transcriptional regulator [Opitutaceae bacterium]